MGEITGPTGTPIAPRATTTASTTSTATKVSLTINAMEPANGGIDSGKISEFNFNRVISESGCGASPAKVRYELGLPSSGPVSARDFETASRQYLTKENADPQVTALFDNVTTKTKQGDEAHAASNRNAAETAAREAAAKAEAEANKPLMQKASEKLDEYAKAGGTLVEIAAWGWNMTLGNVDPSLQVDGEDSTATAAAKALTGHADEIRPNDPTK